MSILKLISLTFLLFSCSLSSNKPKRTTRELKAISDRAVDSAKYRIDKGSLQKKTERLDVLYAAVACTCPQWYVYGKNTASDHAKKYLYLEPATSQLINADTLFNGTDLPVRILVAGQFYERKGYPENYFPSKGNPKPAPIFRYTAIDVVQKGQRLLKD